MPNRRRHRVHAGESIPSLAARSGHFWETLWKHPDNRALAELRKDPTTLRPGDEVTIPPLVPKSVSCAVDARHRFRRRGVPSRLRIQLFEGDEPRAGLPFVLEPEGGAPLEGTTNADGVLEVFVDAARRRALLWVGDDDEPYELSIGRLLPAGEVDGVQQRLLNLGIPCGPVDGELGPRTREAIRIFQARCELEPTGELDERTLAKLAEAHDRVGAPGAEP